MLQGYALFVLYSDTVYLWMRVHWPLCDCLLFYVLFSFACLCLLWQWNYDRSFDNYVIADATDSGCVIHFSLIVHRAATFFLCSRMIVSFVAYECSH